MKLIHSTFFLIFLISTLYGVDTTYYQTVVSGNLPDNTTIVVHCATLPNNPLPRASTLRQYSTNASHPISSDHILESISVETERGTYCFDVRTLKLCPPKEIRVSFGSLTSCCLPFPRCLQKTNQIRVFIQDRHGNVYTFNTKDASFSQE